ncbi:MAG: PDZ domain-containing protein [Myxococcales bacterium]|nr:PDZ domain-containing protein [Deltaproteobacteria bacterium]NND27165.1 PDZ domain-containing protein [Myxococcales bacterium]MBT8481457.1 PDZ domain-containing protein [Deltaproteobacteria bacterium]NNK09529.1 PDZ domain-containing protein [Myxococcales bacterium]NNK42839.1 PDZ domain-containing protein [Myxococcales bacterium]
MNRLWKPLLGLVVVLAAFTVSFGWPIHNGLQIDIDTSPRAQAARQKTPWDLTKLQVMNRVIHQVNDDYVDPKRIDHQRMMLAGLDAIQKTVAPVLVHYQDGAETLKVQVNSRQSEFAVQDVSSPWELAGRFREVFAFLQEELKNEDDLELSDIEYTAVNGMLKTLDPHTVLLPPEMFAEMQTSTRGEFGGLGIVISVRDGHLTVIRPIEKTPASKAGLQRGDRIVKINDESTLNMPLSGAVTRLRGKPGSNVTIFIRRENKTGVWSAPRRVELTRDIIEIASVEHRMLRDNVGYIQIKNFQNNTELHLRRALATLHKKQMVGLVLDLRNNPGGLLDQAVQVADTFLDEGPIVTTSSQDPRERTEEFAESGGTEPRYPMVVLINGQSASASEIVAGALKNHDRALIIGEQSFGKGSVQVLYQLQDRSALKLTVAQYLTPGDVSIQGVGIVPDIAINPMTVDRENMDLKVDESFRESDLESHLTHASATDSQRPTVGMGYYLNPELRQRLLEAEPGEEKNEDQEAFLIRFSRGLVVNAKSPRRQQMLRSATSIIERVQKQETEKVVRDLKKLGIDWSVGPDRGPSRLRVTAKTSAGDEPARAGDPLTLTVEVTNEGEHPLYQLRAATKSDNPWFTRREMVFGKVLPGETRSWVTTLGVCSTEDQERVCRIPRSMNDRADAMLVEFEEAHGHVPEPVEVRTVIRALRQPRFSYGLQIADLNGNGDGRVQRGEQVSLYVTVKNTSDVDSFEVQANLQNKSGTGVLLHDGRFRRDSIAAGEEWVVPFSFQVLPDFEDDKATVLFAISDTELGATVGQKVDVPIYAEAGPVKPLHARGVVSLSAGVEIRERPDASAPVIGVVKGSFRALHTATSGAFERVNFGKGRPGWVSAAAVSPSQGQVSTEPPVAWITSKASPEIKLLPPASYVTRDEVFRLKGKAVDTQRVRDLYISTGGHKVYYESNQGSSNPKELAFDAEIPVHPGANSIMVVAREDNNSVTRQFLTVRRDAEDGSLMETTKFEGALLSNGNGGGFH